jgi:hypothetical protein
MAVLEKGVQSRVARWFVFKPKFPIWVNFGGLAMENHGILYAHLVYCTAIGNILWPFGIICGNLVYFSPFWYFGPRKIWQPWFKVKITLQTVV